MKKAVFNVVSLVMVTGLGCTSVSNATEKAAAVGIATPTKAQQIWHDCEIGLLYCFDHAIAAEIYTPNNVYRERIDPSKYNPVNLDTDQWLAVAKAANAKYTLFTATHFNGFMQWQNGCVTMWSKGLSVKNG